MTPTRRRWSLNYYITQCTGYFISLEIRSVGHKMQQRKPAPSRVGPQAPDWAVAVGEKMLDWGRCPREAGPPGPRLSSPGERERNAVMANRVGFNMLQLYSVSNSLSHTTLSINREVYFSKKTVSLVFIVSLCSACICRCVCLLAHGGDYTTLGHRFCKQSDFTSDNVLIFSVLVPLNDFATTISSGRHLPESNFSAKKTV